jgi:hypothetical protein
MLGRHTVTLDLHLHSNDPIHSVRAIQCGHRIMATGENRDRSRVPFVLIVGVVGGGWACISPAIGLE